MCILSIIILMGSSCDTDCNDCGPVIHEKYFMENFTNERIRVSWFGSGTPSNLSGEFVIPAKQKLTIHESSNIISTETGTLGPLNLPPFSSDPLDYTFDSVKFSFLETSKKTLIFKNSECEVSENPLCRKNWLLVENINTKKEKRQEWEFEIK